jgi:hypothetical protein
MPERPFAFAADSLFVQVRKAHSKMQSLQLQAKIGSICVKSCKKPARKSGIRPFHGQKLAAESFCTAT